MLDRRSLFAATAAVGSFVGAAFGSRKAAAATTYATNRTLPGEVEPRGTDGRHERLPTLHMESQHDFHSGFRMWHSNQANKAAQ